MAAHSKEHHIIPFKTYAIVLAVLLGFTVLTVLAAQVNFGAMNAVIAMLIASVKAAFVLLFFMHLKYDDKTYWVIFGTGIFGLLLLFFFSELDISTRILETPIF